MITAYLAQSIDGFIADVNGTEEFFSDAMWGIFVDYCKQSDAILFGKTTFEIIKNRGEEFSELNGIKKYILTHDVSYIYDGDDDVKIINSIDQLDLNGQIVISGPGVISAFNDLDLIDEYIISIDPIILGDGIGIKHKTLNLILDQCIQHKSGIITLKYLHPLRN